ncbi:glycosyltransferase family 9 protein [Variovorax sp. OV329]|uniref:glycosyltransferase family 9 protein n=1 Tax=Variovorax sp. OV329 TaxID=1882825 RepID=UPI001587EDBD|nr:glycosyltransferase family 9 protein [Variovorax sp. OV329]
MQQERFDLLIQLHDSGEALNPMVAACGARQTAGFAEPGRYSGDPMLHVPLPRRGHEILRLLAVVDHLGIPRRGLHLDWPVRARDRAAAAELVPIGTPLACLHPGADLPSRRWGARHFAAVGDRLAREGFRIAILGTADERALCAQVAAHMREPAIDLAGRTDWWSLGAVVEASAVVVTNDGVLSHLASAVGTPSVVVGCGSDASRWAPLEPQRHVYLSQDLPCQADPHEGCRLPRCDCGGAIEPEQVGGAALRQARSRRQVHTRRADPPPHLLRQVLLQHAR